MTLQRFLIGLAESRCSWLGFRRLKPPATQRMPVRAFAAQVAATLVWAGLVGFGLGLLIQQGPMRGSWWPLWWALSAGLLVGLLVHTLTALAWNRRAARLREAGQTEAPPRPALRWWQRWLVAPLYFLIIAVFTPLALWGAINNAAGEWKWRSARADLVARGEPLTMEQLLPPRPPDEQNFAMTPLLRPLLDYSLGRTNGPVWKDPAGWARLVQALRLPDPWYPPGFSSRHATNDGRVDLLALARGIRKRADQPAPAGLPQDLAQRYGLKLTNAAPPASEPKFDTNVTDAAQEVLDYVARFAPEMDEIATAARRPHSQFPVRWEEGFMTLLPHLAPLKALTVMFEKRAAARVQKGDATGAFADTRTVFRLADSLASEPLLISVLVRIAQATIATRAAWEGLVAQHWDDAQLRTLQAAFAQMDFRTNLIFAFRGERVVANQTYELWMSRPDLMNRFADAVGENAAQVPTGGRLARGLFRRNQVHQNRLYDELIVRCQQPDWPRGVGLAPEDEQLLQRLGLDPATPNNTLARMLAPAISKADVKAARMQTTARLAEVACALERHRLRTGRFPERLEELVPALLAAVPIDPMDGQPLRYRRKDDGWFRLWSVGLNGRNDEGKMLRGEENDRNGDWAWPIPVPSTEPRLF